MAESKEKLFDQFLRCPHRNGKKRSWQTLKELILTKARMED